MGAGSMMGAFFLALFGKIEAGDYDGNGQKNENERADFHNLKIVFDCLIALDLSTIVHRFHALPYRKLEFFRLSNYVGQTGSKKPNPHQRFLVAGKAVH